LGRKKSPITGKRGEMPEQKRAQARWKATWTLGVNWEKEGGLNCVDDARLWRKGGKEGNAYGAKQRQREKRERRKWWRRKEKSGKLFP